MAKWTEIEVGSGKSKKSAAEDDDSLNEEMLDSEDEDQEENEEEVDLDDDNLDFASHQDDEDNSDEVQDEDDNEEEQSKAKSSKKETKPSRSEQRIRELNARMRAAEDRASKAERERDEVQTRASESEKQSVDSEIVATKAALENIKVALKAAVDGGDTDALIKGQVALSENQVRLMALESSKRTLAAEKPKVKEKEGNSQDQSRGTVPKQAREWAERNDGWFNKNHTLTGTALGINQELLEEGFDPQSEDFYEELDARMEKFKPKSPNDKKKPNQEALKKKGTQVVGSSSKTAPVKSVKVDERAKERARRLGIDPKAYLRQVAEYERNKQNEVSTFKPIFINRDKNK